MRLAALALPAMAFIATALPAAAQEWKDTLKWADGRAVHWRAESAPACYGSNVDLKFVNQSAQSGTVTMDGIQFRCANGEQMTTPPRSVGLVTAGSEAIAETILCACAEKGGVTELIEVDLSFGLEGEGRETLANGCQYVGNYSKGKRSGQGAFSCPTGYRLEGMFRDGEADGRGKEILPTGQVYEGDFRAGVREGQGRMSYSNGTIYNGEFKNGLRNGTGTLRYPDGAEYVGEWVDDKRVGYGVYTPVDRSWTYSGDWKDDKREGQGKLAYTDGNYTYEGGFKDDNPHGQGTVTFGDGRTFEGAYVDGKQIGQGRLEFPGGRRIVGDFIELQPHGRAIDSSLSATFDGEWKNGLLDGHVLMTAASGARFDGQYIKGKRNGPGLETYADGSARQCNWVDDVAQEPCTRITAEGKVIEDRRRRR